MSLPVTGLAVLSDRLTCPTGYNVIEKTREGQEADLWKDGLFRKTVRRYLCVSTLFPLDNGRWRNVVTDVKILSLGQETPSGYVVIVKTIDSGEQALQSKSIAVRNELRDSVQQAVCDVKLSNRNKPPPMYTSIGEINGIHVFLMWSAVLPLQVPPTGYHSPYQPLSYQQPLLQQNSERVVQGYADTHTVPSAQRSTVTLQRQKSEIGRNALDDVPFEINPKLLGTKRLSQYHCPVVDVRSEEELENEFCYNFNLERSAIDSSAFQH